MHLIRLKSYFLVSGVFAIAVLLITVAASSRAHHLTTAIYDSELTTSIEGRIVRVDFKNPHVYLYVESSDIEKTWEIEGPPPAVLRRAGWTRSAIAIGDQVVVNGNPGHDPQRSIILLDSLEMANGSVISLSNALAALPQKDEAIVERATSLEGTWGTVFSMQENLKLILTADLALTDKGRSSMEDYVEITDNPGIQCIPATAPAVMLTPDIKTVEIKTDVVIIRGEQEAMERTVYMNLDSHKGATESIHGHSIGQWQDDVLVIDTTHFASHRQGNATGIASGAKKHLTEKLSLNAEGDRLAYSYELADPEYLAQTITGNIEWAYRPDLEFEKLSCDLENAARFTKQ